MPRFDVYANPSSAERRLTPYFLDVQNDYIDGLDSRVVIPLRRESAFGPRARGLHPLLQVNGDAVVLDTAALGAVPRAELRKPVAHLSDAREPVQAALDALFGAY
ncbi:MAG TPA: CcdB family protein [Rubrivivax sp.]|nr:CcdB family protein [Rubrivivax sp.]HPO21119.1 CcdB family protein [Rubrivivax sp.]